MNKLISNPASFIYTALAAEAKPIIEHYKLHKDNRVQAFNVFCNDHICLTITGVGKSAMAAGVAYNQALYPGSERPVMLNIGIAGHSYYPMGEIFMADKLVDNDTEKCYYPPLVFTPPCATAAVITFAKPQENYPESALCDMEATSFYEYATRFSTGELCQCVKIISDNAANPVQQVNTKMVTELIYDKLDTIDLILAKLKQIAQCIPVAYDKAMFENIVKHYHFSVAEQAQLQKLLIRCRALGKQHIVDLTLSTASNGKDYLHVLAQKLNNTEFTL